MPRLVRLARQVDVVHVQGWERLALGACAVLAIRLGTRAPVVQTWHNTFERQRTLARANRALRWLLVRMTASTIVHTRLDLQRLPRVARARSVVIPHGEYGGLAQTGGIVDRDAARTALRIADGSPVTLMFGQLRLDKGLDDLLVAVAQIDGLTLIIGGHERGALAANEELLGSPELAGRVILCEGFLSMARAAELFAAADTVALPYEIASQSGVLLLAYGFARPVVVYPVGGLPEAVIDGETGWICERADREALRIALEASVEAGAAECLRRGRAGERFARERFGWPAIASRTSELYEQVRLRRSDSG